MKLFVWNGLKAYSTGHIFALAEDVEQARKAAVEADVVAGKESEAYEQYNQWVSNGCVGEDYREVWLDIQAEPYVFENEPVAFLEWGCD